MKKLLFVVLVFSMISSAYAMCPRMAGCNGNQNCKRMGACEYKSECPMINGGYCVASGSNCELNKCLLK